MKVSLWKNAQGPARPRTGQSAIRGKTISNPIPIPSPLDDEFPIRHPGAGVASQLGANDSDHELALPPQRDTSAISAPTTVDSGSNPQQTSMPASTMPMPMQPEREPPAIPIPPEEMSREYHSRGQSFSATLPRPSTSPPRQGNSPPRHKSSPPRPRDSPPPRRTNNVHSTVRYSLVSAASTGNTGHSRDAPQRKKSTLRTALGRLFGRKKKPTTTNSTGPGLGGVGGSTDSHLARMRSTSQHRSDPTALANRVVDRGSEPKRSASLPITEFDRALRSHSIGPDDINAIESARNSIQADATGGGGRRRAATTSSKLFPSQRTADGWSGLSPRPASTHGRGSSRLVSAMELEGVVPRARDEYDPDEIGRAITSDLGSRRRSRSLSGLEDIENQLSDVRKRSDEIRYWRESYNPGFLSPLSSNAPDGDNDDDDVEGEGDDRRESRDNNAATAREGGPITTTMIPHMSNPPALHHLGPRSQALPTRTPPQPFTFPGTVASMNEMAGMKITHAANMESRINNLESRMHSLERVVSELCHSSPGFTMPPPDPSSMSQRPATAGAPQGGAGLGIAVSEYQQQLQQQQHQQHQGPPSFTTSTTSVPPIPAIYSTQDNSSHLSFGEAPTFTESIHQHHHPHIGTTTMAPISVPPTSYLQASSGSGSRPTSNSTVRGATSLPQLHTPPMMTSEERDGYASLLALITAEQSARMALEAKVRTLSRRVDFLSTASAASATPQRQVVHLPVHQQEVPGTAKSLGNFSAFDDDSDEDDEEGEEGKGGNRATLLEHENTAVEITIDEDDDVSFSEAFETPREEITPGTMGVPYGYGAFGEELRDDDSDGLSGRRKAARTLSLSQLTIGKGGRQTAGGEEIPEIPATPTGVVSPTANPARVHGANF